MKKGVSDVFDQDALETDGDSPPQHFETTPTGDAEADEHMRAVLAATRDLTNLARRGELEEIIGMESQIGQVVDTISKKKKNPTC